MPDTIHVNAKDLFSTGQIRLAELSVYNWGSFHGLHNAKIDPEGTLITGDNGAGKSTLIDGLMALLLPSGKASFNIAASQGDRNDRSLMSYIRGNYGKAHDGNETSTLLKRPGATVTALRALYEAEDGSKITLAALFWITQASHSLNDLKRLFVVGKRDVPLEELLHGFGEGNARLLKQHLKDEPLVDAFDVFAEYQETYVRLLRMENRNAPALLSRALGLKKIDDLTSLIRDLVLEPSRVKEFARLAVAEFDDLVCIHSELEDARCQREALAPLPETSLALDRAKKDLARLLEESAGLPVYFGEQCYRLWGMRLSTLETELVHSNQEQTRFVTLERQKNEQVQRLFAAYQHQGGASLDALKNKLEAATATHANAISDARSYQQDMQTLGLHNDLSVDVFEDNQAAARRFLTDRSIRREQMQDNFGSVAARLSNEQGRLKALATEVLEIEARPDSNIDPQFQKLRDQIVESLSLNPSDVVYPGELIDVREEHRMWQGAIERALGGHRTTLLVPEQQYRLVTRWLNDRHTGLHVRVQVVRALEHAAEFLTDGFLRKLEWRDHPYRDWLKKHLARFDLHCVDTTDALDQTAFSMTIEGLVHFDKGRFEKKDRQRVDDPRFWSLGFCNKSRLAALKSDQATLEAEVRRLVEDASDARRAMDDFDGVARVWERLAEIAWTSIDIHSTNEQVERLKHELDALERADSALGDAMHQWQVATDELQQIQSQKSQIERKIGSIEGKVGEARHQSDVSAQVARVGLEDAVRDALAERVGQLSLEQLDAASVLEGQHRAALEEGRKDAHNREYRMSNKASAIVSEFKAKWPLVSNEWLGGVDGLQEYLEHLRHLESEGLPELVERFRERLNRNATQSLARISQSIEAEREDIQDRIQTINSVLERTEFKHGTFLRLGSRKEIFEHVKDFNSRLARVLARAGSDDHEARFLDLQNLIAILDRATNPATAGNLESLRLLDSRYQLSFYAEEVEKVTQQVRDVLESSSGKSGGEKESFAGTIVAASLAYVLTPDGYDRPLYCTVFLDEAFSNTAEAVSRRVLKVFRELKIHVNLITPYKNLNLARESARSLLIAERDETTHESRLCEVSWEEVDEQMARHEKLRLQSDASGLGIELEPDT